MAKSRKTEIKIFTIADYEEEETWLREQHRQGWKLVNTNLPVFYHFVKCEPEDVVYRLDYKNSGEDRNYMQMFQDYGWEYFNSCMGWLYFRKPVSEMDSDMDEEIFSDGESKLDMLEHVLKTRMLPLAAAFLCCLIPGWLRLLGELDGDILAEPLFVIMSLLVFLYVILFIHCGRKFVRLRRKYRK
ncbi:MAG: DUF2812 domain-containing protein [Dorea sp.]|nr:DUF2812 domain-containing protein [Dorea sp.]